MRPEEFYKELKQKFTDLLKQEELYEEEIEITAKALSPEQAIGITKRKDYPIITGKDVMVQAKCKGVCGQAFTDAPAFFQGTLKEVCSFDLVNNSHERGIFIAALNAVMGYLKRSDCTVHCKNDGPELCSHDAAEFIKEEYGSPSIALIGYQPSLLESLSKQYQIRVVDLNEKNIGQIRSGILVENGADEKIRTEICEWADLILCTGSTVCNGTITDFFPWIEKTLFFGTTLAGTAVLMDLPRMCFADRYQ